MGSRALARQQATPAAVAGISRYVEVPYDHLVRSATVNARANDYGKEGLAELAALIKAKGLLQPLVVRAGDMIGHYEIFAGGRRHAAVGMLIRSGDWPAARPVPCIERDDDDNSALEASLIENIGREAMHPVREFEVFAEVHRNGADVEAIARRYGVSTRTVRQRLALGRLAPEIREAWSDGKLDADAAKAFAACRDPKHQAAIYKQLAKSGSLQAWNVRQKLGNNRPKLTDPRVAFVGLDRYRAAGGGVVEALFEDDGYVEDGALLDSMVTERLDERCKELEADGWSFCVPESDALGHYAWQRLQPKKSYTPEEKARLKEIDAEVQNDEVIGEAHDALEDERAAIEEAVEARGFSARQKAQSGCVISLDGGRVEIGYGLVRPKPGQKPAAARDSYPIHGDQDDAGDVGTAPGAKNDDGGTGISAALTMTITEQQTIAAQRTVAEAPVAALRLAIAGLRSYANPVKLRTEGYRASSSPELGDFVDELAALGDDVDLAAEFARAVARALDLRLYSPRSTLHGSGEKGSKPEPNAALIAALPGEAYLAQMRALFDPEDYFKRAPAEIARQAVMEMTGGEVYVPPSTRKADLAAQAAERARGSGWLPAELRHPEYELIKPKTPKYRPPEERARRAMHGTGEDEKETAGEAPPRRRRARVGAGG